MKLSRPSARNAPLAAVGLLLALMLLPACHKPVAPAATAKPALAAAKTNAPTTADTNLSLEFVSVFDDRLPRVKTRDPFYPDSTREASAMQPEGGKTPPSASAEPDLKVSGIAGPPARRMAVINNDILEAGDRSEVKTAQGKVTVHIVEIGADYVILTIEGETGQTRLTMEKKKQ